MSETDKRIDKEKFQQMFNKWIEYAKTHLFDVYRERIMPRSTQEKMIAEGYANDESIRNGEVLVRQLVENTIVEEQLRFADINTNRLVLLAKLAGRKPKDLAGTTIISIGGGPGDLICEPWFPRMASTTGASVVNYEVSPAHPLDQEFGIYTHIGGSRGDVFQLLANDVTLMELLKQKQNISIIETNNLIGNNVSPELAIQLQTLSNTPNHPLIIEIRKNLIKVARSNLIEGGVLAIDNAYWVRRNGEMLAVEDNGEPRRYKIFSEENLPDRTKS